MMQDLLNRIRALLGVGIVRLINASGGVQLLQVKMGSEVLDKVPYLETYGVTSVPLQGAEAVVLALGGNHDKALVIAVGDRRYRLKNMKNGEVALYTDEGDFVHIKRGGTIRVKAALKVIMETPLVECSKDLKVAGNVDIQGNQTVGGISEANDHISSGVSGKTHAHGGVVPGAGNSGSPVGGA